MVDVFLREKYQNTRQNILSVKRFLKAKKNWQQKKKKFLTDILAAYKIACKINSNISNYYHLYKLNSNFSQNS